MIVRIVIGLGMLDKGRGIIYLFENKWNHSLAILMYAMYAMCNIMEIIDHWSIFIIRSTIIKDVRLATSLIL